MNQSTNTTILDGNQLANEIWTLLGTVTPANADRTSAAAPDSHTNAAEQSETSYETDLATEILSHFEQKKEIAAAHPGISSQKGSFLRHLKVYHHKIRTQP